MTQKTQYSVQIIVYFHKIMHFTDKTVCSNWPGSNVYISHIAKVFIMTSVHIHLCGRTGNITFTLSFYFVMYNDSLFSQHFIQMM